jgi:predicted transcriptional regulator
VKVDKHLAHDFIRARVAAGATQGEIALSLGVTQQRVARIMRDLGLRARPRGRPRKIQPL